MAQRPLNQSGGEAAVIGARFPADTLAELDRAAKRRGVTRSEMVREMVERGLGMTRKAGSTMAV